MTSEEHPDIFNAAAHSASRDMAQVASVMAVLARHAARHRARRARLAREREEQARRWLLAQERAERGAAQATWTPANDPSWLRNADLRETATAWAAAVRYPGDPAAASAIGNCEARLRDLHPSAIAEYDRLRAAGHGPVSAMRASVSLFARRPAHERPAATARPELPGGDGLGYSWTAVTHRPTRDDLAREMQRRRGVRISEHIQREAGTSPAGPEELRVRLDAVTNLPADLIAEVVASRATPAAGRARQPWRQDFPFPIQQVVATAAAARRDRASQMVPASQVPDQERRTPAVSDPLARAPRQ